MVRERLEERKRVREWRAESRVGRSFLGRERRGLVNDREGMFVAGRFWGRSEARSGKVLQVKRRADCLYV